MGEVLTRQPQTEGVQEHVEGICRQTFALAIAFLPAVLVIVLAVVGGRLSPLQYPGAMDQAQIARNILSGSGFSTDMLTPLGVAVGPNGAVSPDITHPPVYPLILALLFGAFGAKDAVVVWASLIMYVLCVGMIFLIARRHFSTGAAALSAVFFATGLECVRYSISGTSAMAGTFFMLWFWYALTAPGVRGAWQYSKAGAILGLCFLTEYSVLLLLAPVIIYVFCVESRRRAIYAISLVVGFTAVSSIWLVRNYLVMRNPFFTIDLFDLLMHTNSYPGYDIHRTFVDVPSIISFMIAHPAELASKFISGISVMYWQVPASVGLYVLPFFMLALFTKIDDPALLAQRRLLFALLAVQVIAISLGDQMSMHLIKFSPLVIVFASGYLLYMLQKSVPGQWKRGAILAAIVVGAAIPTGMELIGGAAPGQADAKPAAAQLERYLPQGVIVASDRPWAVAWQGRRRSIWLPLSLSQFNGIEESTGRIDAVFVSRYAAPFTTANTAVLLSDLSKLGKNDKFHVVRAFESGDVLLARKRGTDKLRAARTAF